MLQIITVVILKEENKEMKKFNLVFVSLILGIVSFIQLLGTEKAMLAIIIGAIALKYDDENKKIAWIGISLGIIYLLIIAFILVFHFPKLISVLQKLK